MEQPFTSPLVSGVLHTPAATSASGDAFALTHGAGSNHNAPLLVALSRSLAEAGYTVLRYDLPFRQQRPKGSPFPAGAARDREGIAAAIAALRSIAPGKSSPAAIPTEAARPQWLPPKIRNWPMRCC